MVKKESEAKGVLKALGLVFGDIGTSPIYTVTVVFLLLEQSRDNVLGVMSLIIWTMLILVTLQYVVMAMRLSHRGEGGTIVLKEILSSLLKSKRKGFVVTIMAFVGVSLLLGDGVITPAISILSAVEGTALIPGLEHISQTDVVFIACVIAVVLFYFQRKGTGSVAGAFGPVTTVWFLSLAIVGAVSISEAPQVIAALNPYYGLHFLAHHGWRGFVALSEIFLCATGGEALYADMGHLGSRPIRQAWSGVFLALAINYLGQGAFMLAHPNAKSVLFEMVLFHAHSLYVPFLMLSIAATIIASQAMISGTFSVVYQGITTRIMPILDISYTSTKIKSQIYISSVNWMLLASVLLVMVGFGGSSKLAAAYGLAVSGSMVLTGIMMTWIFSLRKRFHLSALCAFITVVDLVFLGANLTKLHHGGYWSLVLAAFPFLTIILYTEGQKKLYRTMEFMTGEEFIEKFNAIYEKRKHIEGTALFLLKDIAEIPPYIVQSMLDHGIVFEDNIFLSIIKRSDPFGVAGFFKEDIAPGLRSFEVQMGYMEIVDIEEILHAAGIPERAVFYGLEDIVGRSFVWKAFSMLKSITPNFINFYRFPPKKLHGVITRWEI